MTAESLARELGGHKAGSQWMALCPAHDDRKPSLAIRDKDGGGVLTKCHASCAQRDVIDQLRAMGLWQETGSNWREWRPGVRYHVDWGEPVTEYFYHDERCAHIYSAIRFTPKSFRQGYPDGGSKWVWKKHPRQLLYRLPELLEAPIVFVTEGEKDVESLRAHGFVATTNAGGAKAPWLDSYSEVLRGREVIIVPDNDAPGWDRAKKIARSLLGKAARIIILDDIHAGGAKDISAWFEKGHSEVELINILEGANAR